MINLLFARRADRGNLRVAEQKTSRLASTALANLMRRLVAILWIREGMG
jgi:hypothetical protein